jgi:hypothetical protein
LAGQPVDMINSKPVNDSIILTIMQKKHDKSIDLNMFLKLKQLTSVPLEVGNLVHDIVKKILERLAKNSSEINKEK